MAQTTKKEKTLTLEEKHGQVLVQETEWPYHVPDNWCWVYLRGLLREIKNGTTIKQDKSGKGYSVTRIESLQNQTIDFARLGTIVDSEAIKETDWYIAGDIVLSHINSAEHVGKTALITERMLPLVHGMNLLRLRFFSTLIPQLFQYYSQSFQYKESIRARINMAVNQVSINQKQIGSIEFPFPPLAEQRRIVDRIESLFAKLDEAKEKVQTVVDDFEDRKVAILHKAFTGELTAEWRKAFNVADWEKVKLGTYLKPMETRKPMGDRFLYIDINSIDNKRQVVRAPKDILVKDAPSRASRAVHRGDVLFSMVRPYLKNIALIDESLQECIASTGFYVCTPKTGLDSKYLYYLLCSKDAIDYLMQFMKGDNSPSIRKSDLLNMEIMLPSLQEQIQIIRILDDVHEYEQQAKEAGEQVIDQIDTMKKSILARAFRGELGTNDPSDENAVELLKNTTR